MAMMGDGCSYYDREKYRDMVLDVAETVLSTFVFHGGDSEISRL